MAYFENILLKIPDLGVLSYVIDLAIVHSFT